VPCQFRISDVSVPYQYRPFSAPDTCESFHLKYMWRFRVGHRTDGTDTELTRHWCATDMELTRHWYGTDTELTRHWYGTDVALIQNWHVTEVWIDLSVGQSQCQTALRPDRIQSNRSGPALDDRRQQCLMAIFWVVTPFMMQAVTNTTRKKLSSQHKLFTDRTKNGVTSQRPQSAFSQSSELPKWIYSSTWRWRQRTPLKRP
jgi:hypothetical protein